MILRKFILLRAFTVYIEKLTAVKLTEVKLAPKWVSLHPKSCERWQWSYLTPKWNFTPKWNLKPIWVNFGSHVNVLLDRSDFLYKIHLKRMLALYVNRNFVTYIMHSASSEFGDNSQVNSWSHYKGNKIMLNIRENLENRCFYNMRNNFIKESIKSYMKYLSFTL